MQLLRDNLTLWTSDMQGEGEDKAGDEEKAGGCFLKINKLTDCRVY